MSSINGIAYITL